MNQILLNNLQDYLKKISVSQAKNINPDNLFLKIGNDKKDFISFIDELHTEGLLEYKYNIICKCSNEHTVYERDLYKKTKNCDMCGKTLIFNEEIKKGRVIYVLDKNEILGFGKEDINFTHESLKTQRLRVEEKGKLIKLSERSNSMKIFIGSSSEAIDDMERVARLIESCGHDALTWQDDSVFVAGQYTYESLIRVSNNVDAAIFVFKADDKTWFRNEEIESVRDNVILEYGLFSGNLGRRKVIFICKDNPKIATDLKGITHLALEDKDHTLKGKIQKWINEIS